MAVAAVNGHRLHYRCEGPAGAPVIVFSNSLGTDLAMWEPQVAVLRRQYRLLRYDTRGQGRSEVTPGPYTIDLLGRDVLALANMLGVERFHFCGLSMGGLIGQWLAVNAGSRIDRLVLANTAARIGNAAGWNTRIADIDAQGMQALASSATTRWFTAEFAQSAPQVVAGILRSLLAADPRGYIANCAAVRDADFSLHLTRIAAPLLFLAGSFDPVTTVAEGRAIVKQVSGSRLVELPAAHLSNIEAAEQFNAELFRFLES